VTTDVPEFVIASHLSPKERLLWSGRPRQGLMLRASDSLAIPFSLLWCSFAIFWEYGVANSNAPIFMQLWGIPFVLVGLYFVFGRFLLEARQRSKTIYGLTDQRVIIVSGLFKRQVKSLNLRTLTDVSLSEGANGVGTISFGTPGPWWASAGLQLPGYSGQSVPSFEAIENSRDVYERVRSAQSGA
jgi:Bacterial PH domain